ncbi:MAG: hypothetical protein EOM06_06265 [Sphingobacteriia bacterium]|nr:hypothetical protein [Sphingobacteriia bacterium]
MINKPMVQRNPANDSFDSTNILLFLYKWRKPLLWVVLLSIVGSVIVSLSITDKYRSTVIMYPAATNAISQALLTQNKSAMQKSILDFGVEEETEQMLQILHSNRIRDKIIEEFGLQNHYNISPDSKYRLSKLHKRYENNISFKRTEFMAIKISVLDTDPFYAADIANRIADLLDSTKNQIQQERAQKAYEIVKRQYFNLLNEIAQMEDSLTKLREFGVNDYESQSEMLNQQLAREMAVNNIQGMKRIQEKLDILAKYGGPYVALRDQLEYEREKLSILKSKYEEARTDAEEVLPTKFVVNSAFPSERKSYPIRWLIVLTATIAAFLFTLIVILIIENIREYLPVFGKNPDNPTPPNKSKRAVVRRTENETTRERNQYFNASDPGPQPVKEEITSVPPENERQEENNNESSNHMEIKKNNHQHPQPYSRKIEKNDNQMDKYFANTNLLKMLFKWKIHLAVILLISIVLAAIISSPLFITPKFRSHAIIYPSNVMPYSEESESEQMLQFLQSRDIRDQLIAKYDLAKRYKIDSSYKYFQSTINYEYNKNVKISKTPYESVRIEVFDADPVIACKMTEDIIAFYNKKVLNTHKEKYGEVVQFIQDRLEAKKAEIDSIERIHENLRVNFGIIDYPNQSREVARGFLRTVDGNNAAQNINSKEVLQLKKNLEQFGGDWIFYNDRLYQLVGEYSKIKVDLDDALMNYNKKITYANVVSAPYPADKKAYPVRWIIVAVTAVGALFLSLIAVLLIENYESIKRNF